MIAVKLIIQSMVALTVVGGALSAATLSGTGSASNETTINRTDTIKTTENQINNPENKTVDTTKDQESELSDDKTTIVLDMPKVVLQEQHKQEIVSLSDNEIESVYKDKNEKIVQSKEKVQSLDSAINKLPVVKEKQNSVETEDQSNALEEDLTTNTLKSNVKNTIKLQEKTIAKVSSTMQTNSTTNQL